MSSIVVTRLCRAMVGGRPRWAVPVLGSHEFDTWASSNERRALVFPDSVCRGEDVAPEWERCSRAVSQGQAEEVTVDQLLSPLYVFSSLSLSLSLSLLRTITFT